MNEKSFTSYSLQRFKPHCSYPHCGQADRGSAGTALNPPEARLRINPFTRKLVATELLPPEARLRINAFIRKLLGRSGVIFAR